MLPKKNRDRLDYPSQGLTLLAARREAGETLWPSGFGHLDQTITVGHGEESFDALAEGVMTWQVQRLAGLQVSAPPRAVVGARVVSGFGVGALRLPVPCEVVWTMEAKRVPSPDGDTLMTGFGYGTLPGHPALGEEAFVAQLGPDGAVRFRVLAFSRPAGFIYTLGSPVTRLAQSGVTRSYLQAARRLAGGF